MIHIFVFLLIMNYIIAVNVLIDFFAELIYVSEHLFMYIYIYTWHNNISNNFLYH